MASAVLREAYEARMHRMLARQQAQAAAAAAAAAASGPASATASTSSSSFFSHPSLSAAGVQSVLLAELPGLGLGSTTWDGAKLLASFLPSLLPSFLDGSVVELGAGTGLAGTAAALLGCPRVLLTDKAGELQALSQTLALNQPRLALASPAPEPRRAAVQALSWGSGADVAAAIAWLETGGGGGGAGGRGNDPLLLLGADVVYNAELTGALVATLAALLPRGRADGCFVMAYRERGAGHAFFTAMDAEGFQSTLLLACSDLQSDLRSPPESSSSSSKGGGLAFTMADVRDEAARAAAEPGTFYSTSRYSVLEFRR